MLYFKSAKTLKVVRKLIRIDGVYKSYGDRQILRDVSLDISAGEIHGLIGKSGAGKSTLLRMINGLENFQEGEISVFNRSIKSLSESEVLEMRKDIGMIFQSFALLSRKTVFENIGLPLKVWGYDKEYINNKVMELLHIVQLEDKKDSMIKNLSGGQRQRVAIARALALEPKILLSDESTSGLDPITTNNILNLLSKINKEMGITVVIVTHEMDVIKKVCNRMSILKDGSLVSTDDVDKLFSSFNPHLMELTEEDSFDIEEDEVIIKLISYSENLDIAPLDMREFKLVKGSIDRLKDGSLQEYYIKVKRPDLEATKSRLETISNLKYKVL